MSTVPPTTRIDSPVVEANMTVVSDCTRVKFGPGQMHGGTRCQPYVSTQQLSVLALWIRAGGPQHAHPHIGGEWQVIMG